MSPAREESSRIASFSWLRLALAVGGIYGGLCALVYFLQGKLLFHPMALSDALAADVEAAGGIPVDLGVSGARLRGHMVPGLGSNPRPTLIYFGGNGENVAALTVSLGEIRRAGWTVALVAYRGYGRSTGRPTAGDLLLDSLVVYDAVAARPDVDPARIVTWGTSLGCGIAVHVARRRPVRGVILGGAYDRLSRVASRHFPWLPVGLLFRHEIAPIDEVGNLKTRGLMLHGGRDQVIPSSHAEILRDAWNITPRWVVLPGCDHNDLMGTRRYWDEVVSYLGTL